MLSVAEFYAESHFRDPFGATEGRPNPHRGLDVAGWLTGTIVPAWTGGTVVTSQYDSALGYVVVVDSPFGFAGVSHLDVLGAPVGAFIPVGGAWGALGDTGRLSEGPHAHLTLAPSSRFPWTGPVIDPTPHIRAARESSSLAGGSTTPITQKGISMAEAVMVAPTDTVVHMYPGVKSHFTSREDYEAYKASIDTMRAAGSTDAMALPPLHDVTKVSWATYKQLCRHFGVAE
ncbi:hypothetical protein ASE14_08160 [Agromyces sp. Root81]|uniref:M23 family metallopeptidase n=1 Tax=Agromyces sp. Root81 TaxID=1736601 RepID=UPI0006F232BB|nr:M23 family metallopeptidase [Agromyces sp. Root81]KRC60924.1 hypothetical protein ASE14_08160 [Agromyces sp. Root81]